MTRQLLVPLDFAAAARQGTVNNLRLGTATYYLPAPSGGDDTAAFTAALAALPTKTVYATPPSTAPSATFPYGTIVLGSGTYQVGATTDIGNLGPFVSVIGPGSQACTLSYHGTGKCLSLRSTIKPADDTFDDLTAFAGKLDGFTIDGTSAGAGAAGLDYGDLEGGSLGPDLYVQNFTGTGSVGVDFNNVVAWTENIYGRVIVRNCTNAVQFRVNGGDSSFSYNDLTFKVYCLANQNGIILSGGAQFFNGRLVQRGNFALSASAQSSAALTLTGNLAGVYSAISYSHLDVQCETDLSGADAPQTINFGSVASNGILNCTGVISFAGTWVNSNWSVTNSFAVGNFTFDGQVQGDTNLVGSGQAGKVILGALVYGASELFTDGGAPMGQGDFLGPVTLTQNITVAFQRTIAAPQKKTFIIKQAASGGPWTVTWPANGSPTTTSPNIIWAGGVAPQMSTAAGAVDVYFLETADGATWYGRAMQASGSLSAGAKLAAGTASAAPLNFQSGTLLTTPAAGAAEYDGTAFYLTAQASSRQVADTEQLITLTSAYTLTSQTAAQKLFNAVTNGALTVEASTAYFFECFFSLSSMSATSGSFGFALGGTATLTSQLWESTGNKATLATAASPQATVNTAANTAIVTATTATVGWARIRGKIRVNAAGTLIPQVSLGIAAAAIAGADSYFRIWPAGASAVTNVGNWS